jgi:response regulator RpfG family c-di-GMP phosphodiesterase
MGAHMKTRIIFVDDNEQIRNLMKRYLELKGYEVFVFEKAGICNVDKNDKCMQEENKVCADIIISDIHMPDVSGIEFVEHLKLCQCKCQNIALISGSWSSEHIQKAQEINCKIFSKPFVFKDVVNWVKECEGRINRKRMLSDCFSMDGKFAGCA